MQFFQNSETSQEKKQQKRRKDTEIQKKLLKPCVERMVHG